VPDIPPELVEPSPRRPRSRSELLDRLRVQCDLLKEYLERSRTDTRFTGEVAAKIRLMACRFGRGQYQSRPLLNDVILEYRLYAPLVMKGKEVSLAEYMDLVCLQVQRMVKTESGGYRASWSELKVYEFVRALAEQAGGAHEDWEVDDWLASGLRVGDSARHHHELRRIAKAVLDVADSFFAGLEVRKARTGSYEPA